MSWDDGVKVEKGMLMVWCVKIVGKCYNRNTIGSAVIPKVKY